jgi:hypothetical protein
MVKAKSKPEQESERVERTPLDAFFRHQGRAWEETGKAFASLLPDEFRTHFGSALEESRASFKALVDGVIDTVECGLDKLRNAPKDEPGKDKVKVEVE